MKKKLLTGLVFFILALLIILLIPVFAVLLVILVLYIPIDYIRYKRSPYCKETKERYTLLAGLSPSFKFFNTVAKESLPIQFYKGEGKSWFGYYIYKDTVIRYDMEFYVQDGKIVADVFHEDKSDEEQNGMELDELITQTLQTVNNENCLKVRFLVSCKEKDEKYAAFSQNENFLLYEDDYSAALRKYIDEEESDEK